MAALEKYTKTQLMGELHQLGIENSHLKKQQSLFFKGPVVVFTWANSDGWPVEFVSPNVEDLFGYTVEDFYTKKVLYADLIGSEDKQRVIAEVRQAETGLQDSFDHQSYRINLKDGSQRWVEDHTQVIRNDKNEITHFNGYIYDVTQQKLTEVELSISEKRAQSILDNSTAAIHVKDLQGRYLQINKSFERLFNISREKIIGRFDVDMFPAQLTETMLTIDHQVKVLNKPVKFEELVPMKGGLHTLSCHKFPLHDDRGQQYAIAGIATDISEQQELKQELLRSLSQHKEAEKLAQVGHWSLDLQNNHLEWSAEVFRIFEIKPDVFNATYEGFVECVHPLDRARVEKVFSAAIKEHVPYDVIHRIQLKNSVVKYIHERAEISYDYDGFAISALGTVQDITQYHQARLALTDAYDDLQLALEDRSNELSRLSQQIKEAVHHKVSIEQDLKKSEYKYRRLMEDASDAILVVDEKTGLIIDANQQAAEITGYSIEQLEGMDKFELFSPSEAEKLKLTLDKLGEQKIVSDDELSISNRFGKSIPIEGCASLIELDGYNVIQGIFRDVSKKRQREQDLLESEHRYRAVFENVLDGILLIDRSTLKVIDGNETLSQMLGYSRQELFEKKLPDLFSLENLQQGLKDIDSLMKADRYLVTNIPLLKKNGETIYADISGTTPFLLDGKKCFVGVLRDNTDRKYAQEKLHKRKQTVDSILRSSPAGIGLVVDRVFQEVNDSLCHMTGYTREELLGQNSRMLYFDDEEYQRVGKDKYDQMSVTGSGHIETQFRCKNGEPIEVFLSSTYLNKNDPKAGVTFTVLNITERKQDRLKLESEKRRLRTLVEEVPAIICIKDNQGRWLEANRTMLDLFGLSGSDYQGKTNQQLLQLLGPEVRETFSICSEYDQQAWDQRRPIKVELPIPYKDGPTVVFDIMKIPLYDHSEKPEVMLVIGHNITDRKRDEIARVKQIERQQEVFVGEVHHRIKNHLQGLIGLLKQHKQHDADNTGYVDVAISQIASIAAVYGLQANHPSESVQLNEMIQAIIQSICGLGEIPIQLEPGSFIHAIELDRNKAVALALVINELIMNAVKHSLIEQTVEEVIRIKEKIQHGCVVLSIINPGKLPRGFNLAEGKCLGTGLELANAMLPGEGASLDITELDAQVVAKLTICPPLLSSLSKNKR